MAQLQDFHQMKYSSTYIVLLFLLFFYSCNTKQRPQTECFDYPPQIDSLQVQDLYDSARWYLYTWLGERQDDNYYWGELEMRYNSFFLRNDSLEIFFDLYLPESFRNADNKSRRVSDPSFAFDIKTRKKLWGWNINGFSSGIYPGDISFDNPRSPEVLDFINAHKDKLNPCFLELAKKLKVLEE